MISRYLFCIEYEDENENLALSRRVPYRYKEFDDNIVHDAIEGEMVHDIAQSYYGEIYNEREARNMFWIICDFQPDPIIDCTLIMKAGQKIIVPSPRAVELYIRDPERAVEFDL